QRRTRLQWAREKQSWTVDDWMKVIFRSMLWPANSLDLNPVENLWWKLKKIVHNKAPSSKADMATAIRISWSQIDEEFCLSLLKSMAQTLQAVIKARGGATKY
uniref:Tc1-like transposase DDE domain-containing protein n=1 Tax=Gouania willdenowi TaxID=441366 RepID=A0A8C5GZT2_GOUWI